MRPTGLNARHLVLLSQNAVRTSLRSGNGIVFILLCLFFGLITSGMILMPIEYGHNFIREQGALLSQAQILESLKEEMGKGLQNILGDDPTTVAWIDYLIVDRPFVLSAIFLAFVFGLPFIIVSGAFNQLSGDIQHRGLRFLLLRTERANVFFARFFGYVFLSWVTWGLLVVTILLYFGFKVRIYEWTPMLLWSMYALTVFMVLSLPYTALCSWISAMNSSPFGALTVGSIVVIVVPTAPLILRNYWEPLGNLKYLAPWWTHLDLFHVHASFVAWAVVANLLYTVVFLGLGYRSFMRRDL